MEPGAGTEFGSGILQQKTVAGADQKKLGYATRF